MGTPGGNPVLLGALDCVFLEEDGDQGCGGDGDEVIKKHAEGEGGHEELYVVFSGRALFTIAGEELDAPAGTFVYISDPLAERNAVGKAADTVIVSLGAKGVVELELVASGEKWGRGPKKDVHSSNRARLDSPAFHLVQALASLVTAEGDPAIEGYVAASDPRRDGQAAGY